MLPFVVVWPVMQLGNFLVVPVAALVAAAFRRWWLAVAMLVAGGATYLLAKVVKGIVPRGRPPGLLADVVIRGAAAQGRGFVSGHAAVVAALVAVTWPWLGRLGRITVCALSSSSASPASTSARTCPSTSSAAPRWAWPSAVPSGCSSAGRA